MKKGRSQHITVRIEGFGRRSLPKSNGEKYQDFGDYGSFRLEIPNDEVATGKVGFGLAWFSIYDRETTYHKKPSDFKIEAKSAVLWDIKIDDEDDRRKGIGSEWIGFMKDYAKSRRAKRFYAANVETKVEKFYEKTGFVRSDDSDWWIMKDF